MSYFEHFAQTPITPIGHQIVRRMARSKCALFQRHLPSKDAAILEVGPGWGDVAEILRDAGYTNYTAVEPNPTMRQQLVSRGMCVKDYVIPHLQEDDQTYDAIFMSNVFEHLNGTPEAQIFVAECRRVLRPGGILCISAPDYLHWKEDFFVGDYTHTNVTSLRRCIQLFQDYGFQAVQATYLSGFFTGIPATVVSHLVRLIFVLVPRDQVNQKWYNLKLTFSRCFLISAVKR